MKWFRTPAPRQQRRGAVMIEFAIVAPVFLLLLIGLMVGACGIFCYQEVAALTREGARYACVHGYQFERTTNVPAATSEEVYEQAILPKIVMLNQEHVTYSVEWPVDKKPGSPVEVTVSYQWLPANIFGGLTLRSKTRLQISF